MPAQRSGTRVAAAERTRETLLTKGLELAEQTTLEGLSVNALVEFAGVSKGTFFHHFGDRGSYLVALHRRFHDAIHAEILARTEGLEPGRERLALGSATYLDACLRQRGVKAVILEARGSHLVRDEVLRRNAVTVDLVRTDFAALGWKHPRQAAQLWVAMNAEAALVELERGRRDNATREAIRLFVG